MKMKTISIDSEGLDLGYEIMIKAAIEYVQIGHNDVRLNIYVLEENMENALKLLSKSKAGASLDRIKLIKSKYPASADIEPKVILHDVYEGIKKYNETGVFESEYTMVNVLYDVYSGKSNSVLIPGHAGHIVFIARAMERHFGHIDATQPQCLVSEVPTIGNTGRIMLDLGGVVDQDLYTLAVMGRSFAKKFLKIEEPKVGFLNIGTEHNKGKQQIRDAVAKFRQNYPGQLCSENGYIEPDKIFMDNDCNVIVTDGFTGNSVLKSAEGAYRVLMSLISTSLKKSLIGHLLAIPMRHIFRKVHAKVNLERLSTAIVLGLTKSVIKCHGSINEKTLCSAISNVSKYINGEKW